MALQPTRNYLIITDDIRIFPFWFRLRWVGDLSKFRNPELSGKETNPAIWKNQRPETRFRTVIHLGLPFLNALMNLVCGANFYAVNLITGNGFLYRIKGTDQCK
uniref:Uncharacterized protein n=1 Tax=Candidatus Kentrum sp. FW TaxID=2126338 RepID=A0A450RYW8_9GAMM|nr:MAG: hypothetical protein BECKFW1821A_GA0114235_100625 [Candidatus Kentron sp. FW]